MLLILSLSGCGSSGGDDNNANSDTSLSGLTLTDASLDQSFQSDLFNYTASVDFSQDSISLSPIVANANNTIQVNSAEVTSGSDSVEIELAVGHNLIEIVITTKDGSATANYTLDVLRVAASLDASLSALHLDGATLDQLFQPSQAAYSASVNFLQTSVTLTPITADANATIQINSADVPSATASTAIALAEGRNLISLVVTAEDGVTTQGYTIEILRTDAGLFAQQAYLKASNADAYDWLGYSVSISDDTLVVGAPYEDSNASDGEIDNSAQYAGAVYVFTRVDGVWSQQAYLKASNAEGNDFGPSNVQVNQVTPYWLYPPGDLFGHCVSISGNTLAVGAPYENGSASGGESDNSVWNAGAVYIFTRNDGSWSQQAYLKASNAEEQDDFGWNVAISGDTLVVGAPGEDSSPSGEESDNSTEDSGAIYVFTRSDGAWLQQAYLKASTTVAHAKFGSSVAISDDTLVVGAPYENSSTSGEENDNLAYRVGAAYVFSRNNGVWGQQAHLKAVYADADDWFGANVAISGDTLVVGAPHEDSNAVDGEDDNSTESAGAAYVFALSNGIWTQQAYLKASNADTTDLFGDSVAISGDTLVVGAHYEDSSSSGGENDNSTENAGTTYVFTRDTGVWRQQAHLKASNAETEDGFGSSVAISGDTLAVGTTFEDSSASGGESDNSISNAGAVYIWQ